MRTPGRVAGFPRGWAWGRGSIGLALTLVAIFSGGESGWSTRGDDGTFSRGHRGSIGSVSQDAVTVDEMEPLRQQSRQKWEADIRAMMRAEEASPPEATPVSGRSVVFYGSSSIRLWDSIAADVAPLVPTRRGFGGAKSLDLAVFAGEVLTAQSYNALVIFVANDISGEADQPEYSPDQVIGWLTEVVEVSRAWQPTAPILLVEVTPTPKRWEVWPRQLALNLRLREWTLNQPGVEFLATAEYFLDAQGQVREELFNADRLHLNSDGRRLWGRLIRRRVLEWSELVQ